ncbi:MAG: DUF4349 domain-containing protein [Lachnospiraceae bacterium]|nr:DUF4349 domain-containing protein [Lachnospiraceae bacterium]
MKKRITSVIAVLAALALLIAGCGSKKAPESSAKNQGSYYSSSPGEMEFAADDMRDSSYYTVMTSNYGKAEAAEPETEKPASQSSASDGRKLVKTMSFNIETQDFDKSTADITLMVNRLGGYVENASVSGNSSRKSDTRTATYVLRIPVASLAEFENGVGGIGNITSRSEKVQDITLTYTDTASRLKSLETQRDALIEMMGKADKLEDLLTIQDHLSYIQYELENYASQLRLYDNQVEYSSVSLKLTEVKVYTEPEEEPETFGERLAAAFKEGLEDAGEFFKDLIIFLAGSLPVLLIFVGIIVLIVVLIKRAIKKRRARKAAARNAYAAAPNLPDSGNAAKD